jgi:drug/metabolite transporter (DMT)-like permease
MAAGQRSSPDCLHHAGLGLDPGLADPRRAADTLAHLALVMAFAGLAAIMGGDGFAASEAKLPGIVMALGGAMGFALGTVLTKKLPIKLPTIPGAAWQIGLGSFPVALAGLLIETTHLNAVTPLGWWLLFYSTVGQFCVA